MAVESGIDGFVAKFIPDLQRRIRDARARLRAFFPRGYELVFDKYNALVFGFAPVDRSTAAFVSIAAYPRWVTLFFLQGRDLDDPTGRLEGSGKQVRSVRLVEPTTFDADVEALVRQAVAPHAAALAQAPPLTTVVKMVAAKQRPRRAD